MLALGEKIRHVRFIVTPARCNCSVSLIIIVTAVIRQHGLSVAFFSRDAAQYVYAYTDAVTCYYILIT